MNSLIFYTALLIVVCCTECKNNNEEISVKNDEKEINVLNDEKEITVKNDSNKFHVNIVLYNQPLDTIKKYIQGKWKLLYGKGGITGAMTFYCDICYIEFTPDNRVLIPDTINSKYLADCYIEWTWDIGSYTNGKYTYIMSYYDKFGYPNVYVIDRIYNDTLIYYDNSCDAFFYHCIKSN